MPIPSTICSSKGSYGRPSYFGPEPPQPTRKVYFVVGDILKADEDVIANPANEKMNHAGGLARIIADASGKDRALGEGYRVATGCAVTTSPGRLRDRFKFIIHAVGPRYRDGKQSERQLLRNALERVIRIAEDGGVQSVACPAISTGIFGFPMDEACDTLVRVAWQSRSPVEVVFYGLGDEFRSGMIRAGAIERDVRTPLLTSAGDLLQSDASRLAEYVLSLPDAAVPYEVAQAALSAQSGVEDWTAARIA